MPTETVDLQAVVASGSAVLCLDTCTILDIVRDPTRKFARAHELEAARDLLAAMQAGSLLIGLVAHQVCLEFDENADNVEGEATRALVGLSEQLARIDSIAAVLGSSGQVDLGHLDGHVARSRSLVDQWMVATRTVPSSTEIAHRAFVRVNQARTPARKGKDSAKDCLVIETYLDVIGKLRSIGLKSKVALVSSNTRDYAGEAGQALKQDLAEEFAAIGMEYVPNLAAAKYYLEL